MEIYIFSLFGEGYPNIGSIIFGLELPTSFSSKLQFDARLPKLRGEEEKQLICATHQLVCAQKSFIWRIPICAHFLPTVFLNRLWVPRFSLGVCYTISERPQRQLSRTIGNKILELQIFEKMGLKVSKM